MASLLTPKRECQCCAESNGVCSGEVVVITTPQSVEVFVRCGPMIEDGSPREQASKFYGCLPRLLHRAGAKMSDVVLERVFFRDIEHDFDTFQEVRRDAYLEAGVTGEELPAASYINQPPCRTQQAFELQVQALIPNGESKVIVESFPEVAPHTTKKLVHIGDRRHLYVMNINGVRPDGSIPRDFREQSDTMFERAARVNGPRHDVSSRSPYVVLSRRHRSGLRRIQSFAQRFLCAGECEAIAGQHWHPRRAVSAGCPVQFRSLLPAGSRRSRG